VVVIECCDETEQPTLEIERGQSGERDPTLTSGPPEEVEQPKCVKTMRHRMNRTVEGSSA
jgi:hypothetical protein